MTYQEYLDEHGINHISIQKFGLQHETDVMGLDSIVIPIKDAEGNILFNKYRHLNGEVKFTFDPGSKVTLFNLEALTQSSYIVICEGEPDCIKLSQEGIAAVCGTGGAMAFPEEWISQFTDKEIYILMDNDEAGKAAALKIQGYFPKGIIVNLPDEIKDVCEFFKKYTIQDLRNLFKAAKANRSFSYVQFCEVLDKWLLLPDKNVIKIITAALVAHHFSSDPLWLFLVAPSSGSKTELLNAVSFLPFIYFLSDLTAQTFASGLNVKHDPSLLPQLNDQVLVMKDFTTVLSMRSEERQMILTQLREIYDGRYRKTFGTGKSVDWQGRLGFMAGVTTIIDTHYSIYQVMGERFIQYRIVQPNTQEVAEIALDRLGKEQQMREELRNSYNKYFLSIEIPKIEDIELPEEIKKALATLASFTVIARSGILRDNYRHQIMYIPEPEAPSRLAKQLGILAKALAVVDSRKKVEWVDYLLTLRVALDTIPRSRVIHFKALCENEELNTTAIAQVTKYSREGSTIHLEDMVALTILDVTREGAGIPNIWRLSDKTREYFIKILPDQSEKVLNHIENIFPFTDFYYSIIQRMLNEGVKVEEEIL